ncbi:50S ribosomal protein L13 [Candidatus Woesearchaeota archaeon]|nr:50S ribosomal protein L13 [Candidatus Woesearchaeota archaeon]
MKVYNGEGIILGRLASKAAKDALLGEEVIVVNCEKAIISGKKAKVIARELQKRKRKGYPLKSQVHPRLPDRMVRRTIRGMLPWKFARGREAYKRIMCYIGIPAEFEGKEMVTVEEATVKKLPNLNYITVGDTCKSIGGKF